MLSIHTTSSVLQAGTAAPRGATTAGEQLHSDISVPGAFSMGFLTLRVTPVQALAVCKRKHQLFWALQRGGASRQSLFCVPF